MSIAIYLGVGLTLTLILYLLIVLLSSSKQPKLERMVDIVGIGRQEPVTLAPQQSTGQTLRKLAQEIRSRTGMKVSGALTERLLSLGIRDAATADLIIAAQFLGPLVGIFAGSFVRSNTLFACLVLAAVGYLGPDIWLTAAVRRRKARIVRSLPDAVDMLVICVEAGLGLDQALLRVGAELTETYPDIHKEFSRVNQEQRAGTPRLEAWKAMAERTKIQELHTFVSMIIQADRFGTPIAKALGRFSDDLRRRRRQKVEEAAAKTKIKIIFPLVFCIFPCLFIVLLAPAILSMLTLLKSTAH